MRFELPKALFYRYQVLPIVIFFEYLSVKVMVYGPLKDAWIILGVNLPPRRIECGSVLAKEFNVLLCRVSCLVDVFGTFVCTARKFFCLVLYLRVESFEGRQNRTFEILLCFEM